MTPAGLLLAAGAGRRMGRPKAFVEVDGRPLLVRALDTLRDGGCSPVYVVLGADAARAAALVPSGVTVVIAADWADGMGASLRAGLRALSSTAPHEVPAALLHLVDLPGVGAEAVSRLTSLVTSRAAQADLAGGSSEPGGSARPGGSADLAGGSAEPVVVAGPDVLARAAYAGVPGHPVLLGRSHWPAVCAAARGDAGARGYLAGHPSLRLVECGDLADPRDVDTPSALREFRHRPVGEARHRSAGEVQHGAADEFQHGSPSGSPPSGRGGQP
jgi:nicotine blue oxidoreductase